MAAQRTYPRKTLEEALRVPQALKDKNGGNPWPPDQVANALGVGAKSSNFFYLSTASRDYGLTEGTRDSKEISLAAIGRRAVYPASDDEERAARIDAFLQVDAFRRVLEHFGGATLPERQYLANTLQVTFGIDPEFHDEFVNLFTRNCKFLGIGEKFSTTPSGRTQVIQPLGIPAPADGASVTVATPEGEDDAPICFVIMPFVERDDSHETGFFDEVFEQLFTPAAQAAGFQVKTARRPGSDVIQSTIVNDLLDADLVLADLTEHNPNVLFELGMRMHKDKPVALVRARGTGPIFDVDNMLRVAEYSPNLWPSTVETDLPAITEHLKGTWDNREGGDTFMKILERRPKAP